MNCKRVAVLAAFDAALTVGDYNRACRLAARLETIDQLSVIDAIIEARNRIGVER